MVKRRLLRQLLTNMLVMFSILLTGCTTQVSSFRHLPQFVISSGGWLSGWNHDGSQLMISGFRGGPFIISVRDLSFPRIENPWDFSIAKGGCVRWSPDGKSVLYDELGWQADIGPYGSLYLLNEPSTISALLLTAEALGCGNWSFDSRQFVVPIREGDLQILRVFDRGGENYRDLLADTSAKADPAWSPDGHTIAFSDNSQIKLVDVHTGKLVETGGFPRKGIHPTWSPDGRYIAYIEPTIFGSLGNLVVTKVDGTQVLTGNQDSSNSQPEQSEFVYTDPMWSPKGDYIAIRRIQASTHVFNDPELYEVILISVPDLE